MDRYSIFLEDKIGNKYDRKNKYILDLAKLEGRIELSKDKEEKETLKADLKRLIRKKDSNPYIIELKEYEGAEREFLKKLKKEKLAYKNSLTGDDSNQLKNLKIDLFYYEKLKEFYKDYTDLTYDAELKYNKSMVYTKDLAHIIDFILENNRRLEEGLLNRKNIDPKLEKKEKKELKEFKEKLKEESKLEIIRIKKREKEGSISKKARLKGIKEVKREMKTRIKMKKQKLPSLEKRDFKRSMTFKIRKGLKQKLKVLNGDISDIRRKTPIEVARKKPFISYLTLLLPGLGQLLNKQYKKAILFFLASLFIYLIAIPYALGFGNYQGQGIAGLISLAQGGAKIHKSLIFMIEGVVAILLLLIGLGLFIISFNDVKKTELAMIKGIRPANWFETKRAVSLKGFPYIASLPAAIIVVFIVLVPVITTFLLSFTNMDPKNQSKFDWIGITNYKLIALGEGLAGSVFWLIFVWTIVWTLLATSLAILIGFFLALIVNNERIRGKKFFRTIYILPWAVPAFITIMFFSIMTAPDGVITVLLSKVLNQRIEIKNNPLMTRSALILMQGWLGSAYVFLLTTGVLQAIPGDLYEAADIDGASSFEKLKKITIPLVLFQIAPLLVTQYTFNFNNFSVIFLFNGGGPFDPQRYGNLAGSSDLLISYIYKLVMVNQYQAIAAAITIFISLGLMFFAFLGFRNSKGFKEGRL